MKKFLCLCMVFGVCMFSGNVFAEEVFYDIGKICAVQAYNILPCEGWVSVAGNHDEWISWAPTIWNADMMHSDAMAAMLAEKEVLVRVDTTNNDGFYDRITVIRVKK